MNPPTMATGQLALDFAVFGMSSMAKAVRSLYGVAGSLNDFVDQHIASMEASPDESIARTGRVLQGAKQGLLLGYAAPVVLIAVGQLLLGNPLSAVGTVLSAAALANPVASTCAAVGAIWFGWKALREAEQQALIAKLSEGFALAADVIRRVISFALDSLKSALSSKEIAALKTFVIESAARVGRSVYAITGQLKDLIYSPENPAETEAMLVASPLLPVLKAMDRETELEPLLTTSLKVDRSKIQGLVREGLERRAARELAEAAGYSLPGARLPTYDDVVRIVARQVKLPTRAELPTEDLERAILFKVMERSLDRMSDEQKQSLARDVEQALRERGIEKKVNFSEVLKFVKFTGMDVGGTVGGLVMSAPGLTGVIGLNTLQFIVLKGIILTSGYVAAGGALLGFGFGGAMLTMAGAAGPIGIAVGLLYTAYSLSGPAFRKLIPAICVIAAKRVELSSLDCSTVSTEPAA
ncbi:hypothetical protein [Roseateles sp. BYS87W]|uniref:Uncharacterized protein n=1 Tax=Pelomonas baiyunensis TaxID=3299026 RepID=A0ABW7H1L4_9BURK